MRRERKDSEEKRRRRGAQARSKRPASAGKKAAGAAGGEARGRKKPSRQPRSAPKKAGPARPAGKPVSTDQTAESSATAARRAPRSGATRAARPKATPPPPEKVAPPAPRRVRPRAAVGPRRQPAAARGAARLTEEEQIESAKYLPRELPPRVFEEERFIFPETYGRSRVRLLVKDPQWLFAHWDVDPGVFAGLRSELGERAAALSRLTLKVSDPEHGGGAVIHLPENARSWYLRADRVRRAYRAELGLTLPSGEYRRLAVSNLVRTPQAGASPRRASRRARYQRPQPGRQPASVLAELPEGEASPAAGPRAAGAVGPWHPGATQAQPPTAAEGGRETKGGTSDLYRR